MMWVELANTASGAVSECTVTFSRAWTVTVIPDSRTVTVGSSSAIAASVVAVASVVSVEVSAASTASSLVHAASETHSISSSAARRRIGRFGIGPEWCVRVQRDDLLTLQVDGTRGSAVAGLRGCKIQPLGATPKPIWNPDIDQPIDFHAGWQEMPDQRAYDNPFKVQWELFLCHVVKDEPFRWGLIEGAKGVQLAELALQSWDERKWMDVEDLA